MELLPELVKRRARRAMDQKPVAKDVLDRLFAAASLAPSCMNNQPWRFVLAKGETLAALKESLTRGNAWAKTAPCIVALCTKNDLDCQLDGGRNYAFFDCGQAAMALQLQAIKEGLHVHPIAGYDVEIARKALSIPADVVILTLIVIAWPGNAELLDEKPKSQEYSERSRKPLSAILCEDIWKFTE